MTMADFPQPDITETSRPFWDGLKAGQLLVQRCENGHRWMPARDFCPQCLSARHEFVPASGRATLVSWVVYRTAFHDAFAGRLPYNVALVELEEGPRMMTNVLCEADALQPGMPLALAIGHEGELAVARFAPAGAAS
ncbi:MAG: OB-fold domain-containing protein [Burkholderiales bacterium]|jgi:uncharacterized OB-fold protein|nr:OB-fold domain-containing protein [Burkholderiales bacterium]